MRCYRLAPAPDEKTQAAECDMQAGCTCKRFALTADSIKMDVVLDQHALLIHGSLRRDNSALGTYRIWYVEPPCHP